MYTVKSGSFIEEMVIGLFFWYAICSNKLTITNLKVVTMHNNNLPMINLLKNETQILIDENECMVMNCGAFNPRFLAKIKKSKAIHYKYKNKEK